VLNPTDEKFVAAIVRGLNQTEAAIAAGLSEKAPKRLAHGYARRNQ